MGDFIVTVEVAKVWHETEGKNEWVYIKGRNVDTDDGYQNRTFAEYKDKATECAEVLDSLNKGDFVELTIREKGKWKNLVGAKKIDAPAAGSSGGGGGGTKSTGRSTYSGGGGSDKMTKAEWAAKDLAKEKSMARHKSLMCAVEYGNDISLDEVLDVAHTFYEYLMLDNGPTTPAESTQGTKDTPPNTDADDDIPF